MNAIVGFTPDGQGWAAIAIIAAKCRAVDGAQSTIDFLGCAIKTAGEHLADPDVAFAAAMDVFGERSFAEAYSTKLQSAATVLNFLGKVVKAVGIGMAVRVLLIRLLDWGSESANSRFGNFALNLDALPRPVAEPAPQPQPQPPVAPPPSQPEPPSQPAPPAQVQETAWVERNGNTITYYWQNVKPGRWAEVDRFRCWRYTQTTHPGGWATDGCGQQTGFSGYPSGSGSVSFTYAGATDSYSVEPWKYGPWLKVGERWTGDTWSG